MKKPINHVKAYGFIIKDFKAPLGSIYGTDNNKQPFICTNFDTTRGTLSVFRYVKHKTTNYYFWKRYHYPADCEFARRILDYVRINDLQKPTHFLPPIRKKDIRTVTPRDRRVNTDYDGSSIWNQRQIDGNIAYNDRSPVNETSYWLTFKK